MGADIELTIEETNKLRAQIGLPLIPVAGKPENGESGPNELNVNQTNTLRASLGLRPLEYEEPKAPLRLDRNEPEEETRGSNLTKDSVATTDFFYNKVDTDLWLDKVGQKTPTKEIAEVAQPMEGEAEVEVAHDSNALSGLAEGEVFTLKDLDLLDEANDVLYNENLAKSSKLKHDHQERKRAARIVYGLKVSYDLDDEDIESTGPIVIKSSTIQLSEAKAEPAHEIRTKARLLFDNTDAVDAVAPIKMKKLKTKRVKLKRKVNDDIIIPQKMVTASLIDDEVDDEDELEALFAASRQRKLKQRKVMTAEEIAREVNSHLRTDAIEKIEGFVYDNTQDFLDFLPVPVSREPDVEKPQAEVKPEESNIADDTLEKGTNPEAKEEGVQVELDVNEPASESEKQPGCENETQPGSDTDKPTRLTVEEPEQKNTPSLDSLLDTLRYLRQTHVVSEANEEQKVAERQQREAQKQARLAKLQITIEERMVREELEKDPQYIQLSTSDKEGTFDRILNERLVQKGIVTPMEKRGRYATAKTTLDEYNPRVKVSYKDEKGNILDKKQAWKQLLHRYHGLAPKHKREIPRPKTDREARDIHPTNG